MHSGEPGLVDRVLALHAGSRGCDSHRGHMSERFFRSNRPGYLHPVSSELENSAIRVAVGDFSVSERRRWRLVNGSVPLSLSGNVVTRIGIHTHTHMPSMLTCNHRGMISLIQWPGCIAQSVGHLTRKSGVLGSIPGLATYFRFSFRFFKKGSCQLLAKVCARSTG